MYSTIESSCVVLRCGFFASFGGNSRRSLTYLVSVSPAAHLSTELALHEKQSHSACIGVCRTGHILARLIVAPASGPLLDLPYISSAAAWGENVPAQFDQLNALGLSSVPLVSLVAVRKGDGYTTADSPNESSNTPRTPSTFHRLGST